MNAFEVVQNIYSSCSNFSIYLFLIFKYDQLQSFHNIFEINKIFFDVFNDLVRNMMISDFKHQLIVVSFDHFRFIDFMFLLIHSWRFFALIIKTFKSCHALFWWVVNEYCAQVLIFCMNSTAKFFKLLYYYKIKSCIVLNLW